MDSPSGLGQTESLGELFAHAGSAPVSEEELHRALEGIVEAARAAWPEVQLAPMTFVTHIGRHVAASPELDGGDLLAAIEQLKTNDLYLACACIEGDTSALALFESHCMPMLERALERMGDHAALGDEAKQALRLRLLVADGDEPPRLSSYSGRGSLPAWVKVAGLRLAINLRQKHHREAPLDSELLAEAAAPGDMEMAYLKDVYRKEFKAAFHDAIAGLEPRQRNLLRNQLIDGLTIDEIGALHRVHRSTAARWIEKVRKALQQDTRKILNSRLQISPGEFESVARLVLTQFDASVRRVLQRNED